MRDLATQSLPSPISQNSLSKIAPPKDLEIQVPKSSLAAQHPVLIEQDLMQAVGTQTATQQAVNPTTPNLQPVEQSCGVSQYNSPTQTGAPAETNTQNTTAPTQAVSETAPVQSTSEVSAVNEVEEPEPSFGDKVKGFFDKVFTVFKEVFNFLKSIFSLVMPFMGQLGPLFSGIFGGGGSSSSSPINTGGSSSGFPTGGSGSTGNNTPSVPVRDPGTTFGASGSGSVTGSSAGLPTGPVLDRPRILG